jgi:hypothetical protein
MEEKHYFFHDISAFLNHGFGSANGIARTKKEHLLSYPSSP